MRGKGREGCGRLRVRKLGEVMLTDCSAGLLAGLGFGGSAFWSLQQKSS